MPNEVDEIESESSPDTEVENVATDEVVDSSDTSQPETALSPDVEAQGDEANNPGPVPYERFSEINRERTSLREQLETARRERAEYEQQVQAWANQVQQQYMAAVQARSQGTDPQKPVDPVKQEMMQLKQHYQQLQHRLESTEQMRREEVLRSEVGSVLSKHPELKPFERAIVAEKIFNPQATVDAIAKSIMSQLEAQWSERQKKYVARKTAVATQTKGVVRGGSSPAPPSKSRQPQTWDEVAAAATAALKAGRGSEG